jgi:GntR family transcriptional regulator
MELKIDHTSPVPMHLQVEQLLRRLIELPEYRDGAFLPRETDLASQLGISRNTIRQATNKLQYEGLIIRKKGLGTKVAKKAVTTCLDSWYSFTHEMGERGISFRNFLLEASWDQINLKLSRFFDLPEKTPLVKLCRLRGDDDGPFVYFESHFHSRIGITPDENFSIPLYELLEKKFNVPVKTSREEIRARRASAQIARLLRIPAGDPVLVRERFVYDPGGRPVEYNIGFYIAEKFTYTIEIKR